MITRRDRTRSRWMALGGALLGLLALFPPVGEAEVYVGGQVGATLPQEFDNLEGVGRLDPGSTASIPMKNSVLYGAKVGAFLPASLALDWLGFEADVYRATPHLKQATFTVDGAPAGQGILLGMTTLAFRLVLRSPGPGPDAMFKPEAGWFDRLQPYIGFGPAVFLTKASTGRGSSSDTAVGYSFQLGSRYFLTKQVALFGEYKLDSATLQLQSPLGPNAGLKGDYTGHNLVLGISYHFNQ